MDKREKKMFIRELMRNAKRDMLTKVDRMPDNWDGVELRRFCADYMRTNFVWGTQNRERIKDYNNAVLVFNLV